MGSPLEELLRKELQKSCQKCRGLPEGWKHENKESAISSQVQDDETGTVQGTGGFLHPHLPTYG